VEVTFKKAMGGKLDIFQPSGYNPAIFTRVSPSGKATASQAVIRGFESHHPLFWEKHPHQGAFFEIIAGINNIAMNIIEQVSEKLVTIIFRYDMTDRVSGATILYIEDNPDNRLLIRRVMQAEGYQFLEAANALEALRSIQVHRPDLILMDINLPGIDGYTLTAKLKAAPQFARIPIIAMTANVMKGDRERTLQAGCDGYIQKPVDIDTLPEQINYFLREALRADN
jgi:two-component system cell cycle response regulator DivK